MNLRDKKRTRPNAATLGRAKMENRQAAQNLHNDFTMKKYKVSTFLFPGRENAIPRKELERLTGLDGRTVRAMIEQERRSGIPILSDNLSGYYLPANDKERDECIRSLIHRAKEIIKTAMAIKGAGN